jgi:hypothetical protein
VGGRSEGICKENIDGVNFIEYIICTL